MTTPQSYEGSEGPRADQPTQVVPHTPTSPQPYPYPQHSYPHTGYQPYGQQPHVGQASQQGAQGQHGGYDPYSGYRQPAPQHGTYDQPTQTIAGGIAGGMPPTQQPPASTPSTEPTPRKRRGVATVALVAAACLLGGGAGGLVGAGIANNEAAPTVSTGDTGTGDTGTGTTTEQQPVSEVSGTVQSAAATIMPSVVVISVTGSNGEGTGSGVVLNSDGDILTNAHVVEAVRNPEFQVTFADGQTARATVVGVDVSSDLAVINVTGVDNLKPATFADSDDLVIGQTVVAVGAPLGLSGTVTEGIVSAVERPVRTGSADQTGNSTVIDAIQTDAAINPGNSGGPLVNLAGEVVGINSAIATVGQSFGGESGNIGVGFAIPSNDATNIADQLVQNGVAKHAQLGISVGEVRSGTGAEVMAVQNGSPAAEAGLQRGDVITQVGDRKVYDVDSLLAAIRDYQPGDSVTISLLRGGDEQTVTVTLGSTEG